jgi:hypothetical protein
VVFVGLPEREIERTVVIRGTALGGLAFASLKSLRNLWSWDVSVYRPATMPGYLLDELPAPRRS